jgi:hypothetical protein
MIVPIHIEDILIMTVQAIDLLGVFFCYCVLLVY